MPARLRVFVLALAASVSPSIAGAQQGENANPQTEIRSEQPGEQRVAQPAGPRLDASATAFRRVTQPADSAALQRSEQNVRRPVALMIVGGAAIVLGSVVDNEVGTLIVIGGVVLLLYGLYRYLQ
jgi:hypothetical protein